MPPGSGGRRGQSSILDDENLSPMRQNQFNQDGKGVAGASSAQPSALVDVKAVVAQVTRQLAVSVAPLCGVCRG